MKKVLLIMAAILLANAVSAQNYEKNILGVRAGLNLSSYSISAGGASISTDSRASFHVAVTDQILLCNKLPFYLETGLAFSSRGGKVDGVSFRPSYLQIPVLVNYHFNIKDIVTIQPFAGLYYGLGIGGKVKVGDEKGDIFGDEGGLKRSDLGRASGRRRRLETHLLRAGLRHRLPESGQGERRRGHDAQQLLHDQRRIQFLIRPCANKKGTSSSGVPFPFRINGHSRSSTDESP